MSVSLSAPGPPRGLSVALETESWNRKSKSTTPKQQKRQTGKAEVEDGRSGRDTTHSERAAVPDEVRVRDQPLAPILGEPEALRPRAPVQADVLYYSIV